MLNILLNGGYGNQLFKIAAAYQLSKYFNIRIKLVWFENSLFFYNNTNRTLSTINLIDKLELPILFVKNPMYQFYLLLISWISEQILKVSKRLFYFNLDLTKFILDTNYFQDLNYIKFVEDEIIENIVLAHSNQVRSEFDVTIHIRTGDFLMNKKINDIHGFVGTSYLMKSFKKYLNVSHAINPYILIVTDNRTLIPRDFLLFLEELNFKYFIHSDDNIECAFFLLFNSHFIIISNSTFSWWAARIAWKQKFATVIYPIPWYGNQKLVAPKIFDDSWIGIHR